jgi:hypothetical protein
MDTRVIYHCNINNPRDYLNLYFFLLKNSAVNASFLFIIKGNKKRLYINRKQYTYIFVNHLDNYDIGGYSLGILLTQTYNYDYFIFLNSSALGPIEKKNGEWVSKLKSLMTDEVGIAGSSIFIMDKNIFEQIKLPSYMIFPFSSVQTYSFILTKNSLNLCINKGFFKLKVQNKSELIMNFEIGISQFLIKNNYNLACALNGYDLDYRTPHNNPNSFARNGDPIYKNAYYGKTVSPFEIIFLKTNRKIIGTFEKTYLINEQIRNIKFTNSKEKVRHIFIINSTLLFETFGEISRKSKKFLKLIKENLL